MERSSLSHRQGSKVTCSAEKVYTPRSLVHMGVGSGNETTLHVKSIVGVASGCGITLDTCVTNLILNYKLHVFVNRGHAYDVK